jgi:predicted O-linked N-acetylglucosamine transferase (SPINDLY family)
MRQPKAPELRLLLACARAHTSTKDEVAIRRMLEQGIDWTTFVQKTLSHSLAGLAGHTLSRLAPDMVPDDVLAAFQAFIEQTRESNLTRLDELARLIKRLAEGGVEAIPFKGPVLTQQAFGDLGLRRFRDLDLLIRDSDQDEAIRILRGMGYERQGHLTEAQFRLVHRLQGQEILFKPNSAAVEPHTRLTSLKMALDIDYAGLWQRARRQSIFGHDMLIFAPEDTLLVLATHGGKELWWDIKWACDIADFIVSHPDLDWHTVAARARSQGCFRMLLLATSLARNYLGAAIPDLLKPAEIRDTTVDEIAGRVLARWEADDPGGPPSNKTLSKDRLLLHDGIFRRTSYVMRTLFLPGPQHVPLAALPAFLNFAYIPMGLAHDLVALPPYRAYRQVLAWSKKKELDSHILTTSEWAHRALTLLHENQLEEALECSSRALELDPANQTAIAVGITARIRRCDWHSRENDTRNITQKSAMGLGLVNPIFHRAICDSEAELFAAKPKAHLSTSPVVWNGGRYRHDKIRLAYISTDLRDHVISNVMAGCFEHHDKTRFETIAISLGPDDKGEMRPRIQASLDQFIDARDMSDSSVAEMLRELEADIAIDLNGYSGWNRTGILARRPAPVQVNYLGFPGTMNAPFMDYIVADQTVIPEENQIYYREKVVYLPYTYFPTDRSRPIARKIPSRSEAGLPENGFVFACHNAPHKISPEIFDIWMRLLRAIDGSVLWLQIHDAGAMMNLRQEAKVRGVAPERLTFAPKVAQNADHLARLGKADLFLDTLPYNAHATANDALWAGLPVLTCLGNTFSGRVAASQLYAIGLPELVTTSLAEYEAFALALASNPDKLAAVKAKLINNRNTEALFDTPGFTRYLEAAFRTMWQRQQAGLTPSSFIVPR